MNEPIETIHRPLDHWRLVRRKPDEVARLKRLFVGLGDLSPGLHLVDVEHEADDRCCRREPWRETFAALMAEIAGGQA